MKLFTDMSTEVEGIVELNEASGEKTYVIKGTVSSPGKKNRNGRVYPLHLWEANVKRYHEEITNNTINTLCELEHPARSTVNPWEAVAKTRLLEMRDGIVYGEMEILNNNAKETNQLKALIDAGVKIGVSTRGVGRLGKGAIVEEYQLITTDIVANPSDYGANLNGFTESMIVESQEYSIHEGKVVCTPEGCSLEQAKKLEEGKESVLADKLLASFTDTKSQIAFERKYGSVYKMSKEELLKHLANMNEGTGSSDIAQDTIEETLCTKRAKALTEAFQKFSAEPVEISEKAIQAFDIIALHEKKPTFKEIQKKIADLQKEMKKHKKGSDEWDVLDFELTGYEEYLAKTISKGRGPKNVNEVAPDIKKEVAAAISVLEKASKALGKSKFEGIMVAKLDLEGIIRDLKSDLNEEEINEAEYRNIKQVLSFLDMCKKGLLKSKPESVENYGKAAYDYLSKEIKAQKIK